MITFRTSAPRRPYGYIAQPQRVAARQQMHGSRILPMERRRDPTAKFFICAGLAIALLFVGELIAGAFR